MTVMYKKLKINSLFALNVIVTAIYLSGFFAFSFIKHIFDNHTVNVTGETLVLNENLPRIKQGLSHH